MVIIITNIIIINVHININIREEVAQANQVTQTQAQATPRSPRRRQATHAAGWVPGYLTGRLAWLPGCSPLPLTG